MTTNIDTLVQSLGNLTIPEIVALTKQLEEAWGVKAQAPTVSVQTVETVPVVEQTEFTVILHAVPTEVKMNTIKAVRELLAIGLKEAKDFVEAFPKVMKEGISREEADLLVARLADVGAIGLIK